MSRNIMRRKTGAGDAIGRGRWGGVRPFEKSAHLKIHGLISGFCGREFDWKNRHELAVHHIRMETI